MVKYCDERVCVCACVCVCFYVRDHIFGTTPPIFTKFFCLLLIAAARFSSGGVAIRYVLPVLWMMSYLLISQGCSTYVAAQLKRSAHATLGLAINCAHYYHLQANGRTGLLSGRSK